MKVTKLLSEIYRLLLEDRRSSATDLLVDFMSTNQKEFAGIHFGKIGSQSQGSPEEIVSRLRKNFIQIGLFNSGHRPKIIPKDPHDLDDEDLELIDSVATEWKTRSELYAFDEEDTTCSDKNSVSLSLAEQCRPLPFNEAPPQIDKIHFPDDEDDEDLDRDLDLFTYEPTESENNVNYESIDDEDDDDFKDDGSIPEDIEPLDDLFFEADSNQCVGIHVDHFVDDCFDFDENDVHADEDFGNRCDIDDVDTSGGLSREERARQIAVSVAVAFGFNRSGVDLLSEIFEEHGWGQARIAIEYLLETGITEEELRLVKELKDVWEENEVYGLAFLHPYNRTGYCTYQGGRVLSWRMAEKLTRLFPNGDICEVEAFLDKAFDAWYEGSETKYRYPVFINFLKNVISRLDPERCLPGGMFIDDLTADDFEYEIEKDQSSTFLYRNLVDYGLITCHRANLRS